MLISTINRLGPVTLALLAHPLDFKSSTNWCNWCMFRDIKKNLLGQAEPCNLSFCPHAFVAVFLVVNRKKTQKKAKHKPTPQRDADNDKNKKIPDGSTYGTYHVTLSLCPDSDCYIFFFLMSKAHSSRLGWACYCIRRLHFTHFLPTPAQKERKKNWSHFAWLQKHLSSLTHSIHSLTRGKT